VFFFSALTNSEPHLSHETLLPFPPLTFKSIFAFADATCSAVLNFLPIDANGNAASQVVAMSSLYGTVGVGSVVGGRGAFKCASGTFGYNRISNDVNITLDICVNPECFE
jgi:hypothetical protein